MVRGMSGMDVSGGPITDGIFSSLTPLIPTPLPTCSEIEMRPQKEIRGEAVVGFVVTKEGKLE
jgi:type VI protein secretion system component VasA